MNRDPDSPYDESLVRLVGTGIPSDNGTLSRKLLVVAAKRRLWAQQLRDTGTAKDISAAALADHDAAYLERHAERLRSPQEAVGGSLTIGLGGEVMAEDPGLTRYLAMLKQSPDMLALEATEKRMTLTGNVSDAALTLALDAAENVAARDGLDQMLCHQIAASHTLGMIVGAKAHNFAAAAHPCRSEGQQQMQSIEAARMAKAAALLFDTSQRGMMALLRRRQGGHQRITVQHVTVQEGGQAVVTGTLTRRRKRK